MSDSSGLAPAGSSTYSSDTLHVGDGTWDAGSDDFLLPPLVGLNFATMRYNGMGNRFSTLTGYHSVVKAHGIIAAITFLFLVPAAIFIMRFGGRRPALAKRFHIWIQILTLLLSTVVLILGVFAVGPSRALTNPHHGIGVAIYTLIWVQAIGGCLVYRRQRKTRSIHIPLRAMLHHWLGRAIALLGIAQVALGLTLYGSPVYLFVLYTLVVFALIVLYFIFEWLHERRRAEHGLQHGSEVDEEITRREDKHHGGLGKLAAAGAAGVGLAALFKRRSSAKHRPDSEYDGTESGTSYMDDEKESRAQKKGWGRRILEVGAIGGGLAAAKGIFGRKRASDEAPNAGPYRPPLGGNTSVTTDSMSHVGDARPARPTTPVGGSPGYVRPSHPLAQPPMTPGSGRRHSDDTYSYYSYMSDSPSRRGRHQTFREALAAGGTVFAVRQLMKNRRQKKEDKRAENLRQQNMDQERIQRMNGANGLTGDGVIPPRRQRHNRINSQTASDFSTIDGSVQHVRTGSAAPMSSAALAEAGLAGASLSGAGIAASGALADRDHIRPPGTDPVITMPGPASAGQAQYPPPPPPHGPDFQSSGSELYTTASGRQRHRHHNPPNVSTHSMAAPVAATGLAAAAAAAESSRRRPAGQATDSMESPPVSLSVKMKNDGRHVTLRRLTEEEAAAQREARRRERRASSSRRRRDSTVGSQSGSDIMAQTVTPDDRWRRTEALEARQAADNAAAAASSAQISVLPPSTPAGSYKYPTPPPPGSHHGVDPQSGQSYTAPPPPPIPASTSNLGPSGSAITTPGTETSGATGATEYANNRRRRRAERAQARLAREGRAGGGNTVEFS